MAAAAVEQPMTAQERVLTANDPPTREEVHPPQSYHQRIAFNARGTGVAAMFGAGKPEKDDVPPPPCRHTDPSEFLAGPTVPGHIKHGVRRYEDKYATMVGVALTEDWIRGRGEDDPIQPHMVVQRGPRNNLEGPCCSVKYDEPKHRPLRAPGANHQGYSVTSPYYESEVPQEPLPDQPFSGKRRFNTRDNGDILSTVVPGKSPESKYYSCGGSAPFVSFRKNKANESKDILNLGQYSPEQLNETERKIVSGPRLFIPQDLPPRRRPAIARVKAAANETHDIFGTGELNYREDNILHKKRSGNNYKHEPLDIFDTTPAPQAKPKQYNPSGLLDFNVRTVHHVYPEDRKSRPAFRVNGPRQPEAKVETGSIFTSMRKDADKVQPRGRARGKCVPKANGIF